jgi:hypothetical protein
MVVVPLTILIPIPILFSCWLLVDRSSSLRTYLYHPQQQRQHWQESSLLNNNNNNLAVLLVQAGAYKPKNNESQYVLQIVLVRSQSVVKSDTW